MKAYFVTGVECGCNHIVTRLFCDAGCDGVWQTHQPLDDFLNGTKPIKEIVSDGKDIVYNEPTGGKHPSLLAHSNRFKEAGYEVIWVMPYRRPEYVLASRKHKGVAKNDLSIERVVDNYAHIETSHKDSGCKGYKLDVGLIYNDYKGLIETFKNNFGLNLTDNIKKCLYDGDKQYEKSVNN